MSREAMKLALEALEDANDVARMEFSDEDYYSEAINALRQALVDADDTSQKCVVEMVKTEHDRAVELGKAYERGWNAALAQQEPVAWLSTDCIGERYLCFTKPKDNDPVQPLYTTPPKREWVGLTDEELYDCEEEAGVPQYEISSADLYAFAQAIEAKLREKNHG
jgi:hypothetical protein